MTKSRHISKKKPKPQKRKRPLEKLKYNTSTFKGMLLASQIDTRARAAYKRNSLDLSSGIGYPMDKEVRRFLKEYNSRIMKYGNDSLPVSIHVLQDFYSYNYQSGLFNLLPEKDHLFSYGDYIDFITSQDFNCDPASCMDLYQEGVIYSYNSLDNPTDLVFSMMDNIPFGVRGVSFVRHQDELSILLLGGQEPPNAMEWLYQNSARHGGQFSAGREDIAKNSRYTEQDALLEDYPNLCRILCMMRVRLTDSTMGVAYVYKDIGNSYSIKTNDPNVTESVEGEDIGDLSEYQSLLEVTKSSIFLPAYFAFKYTLIKMENGPKRQNAYPSDFLANPVADNKGVGEPQSGDIIKRVAALRVVSSRDEFRLVRRFSPPRFQVQVNGFWRTLRPGAIGKDALGNAVEGKTWVNEFTKWRDRPPKANVILVKSKIAVARSILHEEQNSIAINDSQQKLSSGISREQAYRERKKLTAQMRYKILLEDDFRCKICGRDAATDTSVKLEVDHITSIFNGGLTVRENLRTVCRECNRGKGKDF